MVGAHRRDRASAVYSGRQGYRWRSWSPHPAVRTIEPVSPRRNIVARLPRADLQIEDELFRLERRKARDLGHVGEHIVAIPRRELLLGDVIAEARSWSRV